MDKGSNTWSHKTLTIKLRAFISKWNCKMSKSSFRNLIYRLGSQGNAHHFRWTSEQQKGSMTATHFPLHPDPLVEIHIPKSPPARYSHRVLCLSDLKALFRRHFPTPAAVLQVAAYCLPCCPPSR